MVENKEGCEIEALRQRCITGNHKLNVAWRQLREMDFQKPEVKEQLDVWTEKTGVLGLLGIQLNALGYTTCLYMEDGVRKKKCLEDSESLICWACPSDFPYWESELFGTPEPGDQTKLEV